MPPIIPTIHYRSSKNQLNTAAIRIQYSMLMCSVHMHAGNTLISSKYFARFAHTVQPSTMARLKFMPRPNNILTPRVDRSPSADVKLRAF